MTHGTVTAYRNHGCRCRACRVAANRYQKSLRYETSVRGPRLVDASPVHDRIHQLRAAGYTWADIAAAFGYSGTPVVHRLCRQSRVRRSTLERILNVHPDRNAGRGMVDATGTRRRLQALARAGWSLAEISRRTGLFSSVLSDIRRGRFTSVRGSTEVAVRVVFDEVAYTDGGSARARLQAIRAGWAPAAAWDDIDDPDARPEGVLR